MFFKTKKTDKIDTEAREQYEYARKRVTQKKNLMRHFIFFLAGEVTRKCGTAGITAPYRQTRFHIWQIGTAFDKSFTTAIYGMRCAGVPVLLERPCLRTATL